MEKRIILISFLAMSIMLLSGICSAAPCSMSVNLINQDPYPATPGDYVKLVFQITGTSDPDCGNIVFELKNKYPISFDPGVSSIYSAAAGSYAKDYGDFITVPFKIRVDESAVNGDNPIETSLSYSGLESILNNFTLSIEDLRADFDVYVKDYDTSTNIATLEILNIGKSDVKAIAVTIPPQQNIEVKGPNKNIVGDLDANEYTTANFELSGGGNMNLEIDYTDTTSVRRSINKTIVFDPLYFENRKQDQKTTPAWAVVLVIIVVIAIIFIIYRRYKKRKHQKLFSK